MSEEKREQPAVSLAAQIKEWVDEMLAVAAAAESEGRAPNAERVRCSALLGDAAQQPRPDCNERSGLVGAGGASEEQVIATPRTDKVRVRTKDWAWGYTSEEFEKLATILERELAKKDKQINELRELGEHWMLRAMEAEWTKM